jgi:hypothetical protein
MIFPGRKFELVLGWPFFFFFLNCCAVCPTENNKILDDDKTGLTIFDGADGRMACPTDSSASGVFSKY